MNSPSSDINPDRLLELERFAEIGRLSAGLLHEISNPLAAAMLWLEQYENRRSPNIRHIRRSMRLLQRYVEAARQQVRRESNYRDFYVQPEIEQVKQVLAPIARYKGVGLRFASAAGYKLHGDPVKFQQIIANLVSNAIDSYGAGGVSGSGADSAGGTAPRRDDKPVFIDFYARQHYLVMEVSDRGCGIDGSQLAQLFQPFYSTKSGDGLGLGIGLSAVKRYIETDFRGNIRAKSSSWRGTQFIVKLPMAKKG